MKKINVLLLSVLLFTAFTISSCSDDDDNNLPKNETIVDVAKGNPQFSTLVTALTITGLDKALDNKSASFTVFAPTNAAFASLLTELKYSSLNDIPKETLSNILLYHVLDGAKMAASIETGYFKTLAKGAGDDTKLSMMIDMGSTMINKRAKITGTDVKASNGVIHVINGIITEEELNILKNNELKVLILGYKEVRKGEKL